MREFDLFTVGHSNRTLDEFLCLLKKSQITAVADVRSQPVSGRSPHFSAELLEPELRKNSIRYVFLGRELGARRTEAECYRDNQARYELISETSTFKRGLERVRKGVASQRIALLCSERDPLECHRSILICRHLRHEFSICHLHSPEFRESHDELEQRLLQCVGLSKLNLFGSPADVLAEAYERQGRRIAFTIQGGQPDQRKVHHES